MKPIPDYERYQNDLKRFERMSNGVEVGTKSISKPILHYKNGPVIKMNSWQRERQKKGQLPGCIANCQIPPIGSVNPTHKRGLLLGVQFPNADDIMQKFRQKFKIS